MILVSLFQMKDYKRRFYFFARTLPSVHCTVSSSGGPIELFRWKSGDWTKLDTNVGSLPASLRACAQFQIKRVTVGQVSGIDHPKESAHVKYDQGSSNFVTSFHTKLRSALPKARGLPSTSCAQNFLGEIIEKRLVVYYRWKLFRNNGAFCRFFL